MMMENTPRDCPPRSNYFIGRSYHSLMPHTTALPSMNCNRQWKRNLWNLCRIWQYKCYQNQQGHWVKVKIGSMVASILCPVVRQTFHRTIQNFPPLVQEPISRPFIHKRVICRLFRFHSSYQLLLAWNVSGFFLEPVGALFLYVCSKEQGISSTQCRQTSLAMYMSGVGPHSKVNKGTVSLHTASWTQVAPANHSMEAGECAKVDWNTSLRSP